MDKVTKKFPENEPRGLEENVVPIILRQAIVEYVVYLAKQDLGTLTRTVVRPHQGGMIWLEVEFPNYPQWLNGDTQKEALNLDGVVTFFDYVWERGEMARSFTGPNPTRRTWEASLFQEVFHLPIKGLLNFSALMQAVDTGSINEPWVISSAVMDKFVNELTKRYCKGLLSIVVQCPLAWFNLQPGTSIDLGGGMTLHNYDEIPKALYLSQTDNRTLWHDLISKSISQDVPVLELTEDIEMNVIRSGKPPKTCDDLVKEIIANKLDFVKWAIVTAIGKGISPIEGTITYGGLFGERIGIHPFGSMRREDKSSGTVFNLDTNNINTIRELVSTASIWREKSKDIRVAFWYWGRAALTDLSRDRLLESVIGLESLLIPNSGETRYRFGLNGAALLACSRVEATEKANELRKIYDKRSSAAHGGSEESFNEANVAHKALGDLIAIVLHLYKTERMNLSERFATQLEKNILAKAWLNPYEVKQIAQTDNF
jgi:hypothetical protein